MSSDPTIPFAPDDPQMEAAIKHARMLLGVFFAAYTRPKPNQRSFLIKARFEEGEQSEHIWLADLNLSKIPSSGTVANEGKIPRLKFMQTVEFVPDQITDWMYIEDGFLMGGFTTKIIRRRMTEEERASYESSSPYKFLSDEDDQAALKKAWKEALDARSV
jgi:uncharacterized protein YegJ (DUF2314 family)